MARNKPESLRSQLDRDAWIKASLDVLAEKGLDGIRVEVLAKRLKVTKGSFYWHFKDRQDLFSAVLQTWKEGRIRDIDKQSRAAPGKECDQLLRIIDTYSANRNRKGMLIEFAMRDWARRDPAAAAVVEEVDANRLEFGRKGFEARGMSPLEASSRSLLLYAYVFGLSLMSCGKFDADMAEMKRWIADRIAR